MPDYLTHLADAGGAIAILSASDNADAAIVLAGADATQLIKANASPSQILRFGHGNMRGCDSHAIEVRTDKAKRLRLSDGSPPETHSRVVGFGRPGNLCRRLCCRGTHQMQASSGKSGRFGR